MPWVFLISTEQSAPAGSRGWLNGKIAGKNSRNYASNFFHLFIFLAEFVFYEANLWA
jgi:hypothetical protein